jgi:outer membrane protein TolC
MRRTFVLAVALVAAPLAASPLAALPLDLTAVLGRARPSPAALAVERELAEARRDLARSAGMLLEGPAVSAEAGPRTTPDGDDGDIALGVDLPLAGDSAERRVARETWERAARERTAAAALEARLAIELAYVEAWEAAAALALAGRELETLERWRAVVDARDDAGAAAAFERVLVDAELESARLESAEARARARAAWSALDAVAAVGAMPLPLDEPPQPQLAPEATGAGPPLLVRAARSGFELERARIALEAAREASRWSLGGSLAREGDEEVARLGVGYRLPLGGEGEAIRHLRAERERETARAAELAEAELAARRAAALERWRALVEAAPTESRFGIDEAAAALEARLAAGKDRPTEALLVRRELVRARATRLAARAARLRAAFELAALTTETLP